MEAKLHFHTINQLMIPGIHRKKKPAYVVSVLSKPPQSHLELSPPPPTAAASDQVVYKDNWFDRIAIQHLSSSLQSATAKKSGYDGLVEAATVAYRNFTASQQREIVIQTLETAFPRPILNVVKESEFEGKMEKNVVQIKKCRFLEGTNCVGMCTNLCKMPSQEFIKESFGIPFYMVPNFDDMSCEMIFGQQPPLPKEDPAFLLPCYKLCKEKRKHSKSCPTGTI